nr:MULTISPECIES: ATP-binding protein [Myxococcaceae]
MNGLALQTRRADGRRRGYSGHHAEFTVIAPQPLVSPADARSALLLVDDIDANLVALEAVLEPLGARLVKVSSGEDALRALLQEDFACILLDVQMPGLDGLETATLIKARERSRHIPILFVTAHPRAEAEIVRAYSAGAVDYLQKPFSPDLVRSKVQVFLDLSRHEHALQAAERQLTERARAEGEQRFRHLLDSTNEGIWGLDLQGRCIFANPACVRLLGYAEAGELLGQDMHAAVHHSRADGNPYPVEDCRIQAAPRDRRAVSVEDEVFFRKDGQPLSVYYLASPLYEGGQVSGAVVAFSDRTEGQRLQAALEEAVRQRDDFLSAAAHELRTPLTSLKVQLELTARALGTSAPPAASARLKAAGTQVARLTHLVEGLLVVSQLKSGGVPLELAAVDLVEVAREAIARVEERFEQTGSPVTLQAPEPVLGRWDALRLHQVVVNLLLNAVKYGAGAPVQVRVWRDADEAHVSVQDAGLGIAAGLLSRIFGGFEQGPSGREQGGLGLGLSIAQQIVQAHGGRLRVESMLGKGSTFTATLPLAGPGD